MLNFCDDGVVYLFICLQTTTGRSPLTAEVNAHANTHATASTTKHFTHEIHRRRMANIVKINENG